MKEHHMVEISGVHNNLVVVMAHETTDITVITIKHSLVCEDFVQDLLFLKL